MANEQDQANSDRANQLRAQQLRAKVAADNPPQPGMMEEGGFVDKNVLSGQIPMVATGVTSMLTGKNPVTSPIPVGLVGGGAEQLERIGRALSGLDVPSRTPLEEFTETGKSVMKHAALEAGGQSIVPGVKAIGEGIAMLPGAKPVGAALSKAGGAIKNVAKEGIELTKDALTKDVPVISGAKSYFDKLGARKVEQGIQKIAADSGVANQLDVGREVASKGDEIFRSASDKYQGLKSSMLNKFGDAKISPEGLRKGLDTEIARITELAADLDPNDAALKGILQKWQSRLAAAEGAPTLRELDDITTTLYNASQKQNANPAFKRLYQAGRENLLTAMDDAVVKTGESSKGYVGATKAAQEALETATELEQKAAKNPFWIKDKAGEVIQQPNWAKRTGAEKVAKELEQANINFDDISEVIANLDSENEVLGTQAREAYGAARKQIAQNLKIKDGPIGKLIEHGKEFPSEVIEKSRTAGRLDLPEVVQEAIDVNPEFKDVARKTVLGDIFSRANDAKSLKKAMDQYKNVLPIILDETQLSELMGMTGAKVAKKGLPWMKDTGSEAVKEGFRASMIQNDRNSQ